jgi:hypothetical protein
MEYRHSSSSPRMEDAISRTWMTMRPQPAPQQTQNREPLPRGGWRRAIKTVSGTWLGPDFVGVTHRNSSTRCLHNHLAKDQLQLKMKSRIEVYGSLDVFVKRWAWARSPLLITTDWAATCANTHHRSASALGWWPQQTNIKDCRAYTLLGWALWAASTKWKGQRPFSINSVFVF